MRANRSKSQRVFVIKNVEMNGIVEDDIIETEPFKFKSVKFRHTFYNAEDFVNTVEEVYAYLEVNLQGQMS